MMTRRLLEFCAAWLACDPPSSSSESSITISVVAFESCFFTSLVAKAASFAASCSFCTFVSD